MSEVALQNMLHWVSAVADNIRNPVAGISAALDILTREMNLKRSTGQCDEDLIDDACQRMRKRFASLQEYVTELVDFGQPLVFYPERLTLGNFFTILDSDFQQTVIAYGGVSLCVKISKNAYGSFVDVDPRRLAAAVKALLRNASEASLSAATPKILVGVEKVVKQGSFGSVIHVDDNGSGFHPAHISQVFDPFFSTKEAGTGLGLSLVRRYVEAHGGQVTLGVSTALGGAQVSVWLPESKL